MQPGSAVARGASRSARREEADAARDEKLGLVEAALLEMQSSPPRARLSEGLAEGAADAIRLACRGRHDERQALAEATARSRWAWRA